MAAETSSLPLTPDALHAVLGHLNWNDLLAVSATCRQLRDAARQPALWSSTCRARWAGPLNTGLFGGGSDSVPSCSGIHHGSSSSNTERGPPDTTDYQALFMADNGWAAPRLEVQRYAGVRWADEIVAVQPATTPDGTTTIAVSSCRELRVLQLDAAPGAPLRVLRAANHSVHSGRELWSSIAALSAPGEPANTSVAGGEGWLAAGGCHGRLAIFQVPECSSASPAKAAVRPTASLDFPDDGCPVSQLHYLPAHQRLGVLHDSLAVLRPVPQRSALGVVDAATWRHLTPGMRDVLEGYELAAVAAVGDSGAEWVAGSVRLSDEQASGWNCRRCHPAAPAALCFHKSPAAAAALCMFDCRAAQPLVSRYSTHHRSLHPHVEPVRGHFLLTSHAGTPVAVWDRRQMNGPVHEVSHMPRVPDPGRGAGSVLPLDHPDLHDYSTSQALHLSATHDLLLGRADNGMCWLFDVSERLGWADGRHAGSWLHAPQVSEAAWRSGGAAVGAPAEEGDADMAELPDGVEVEQTGHLDEGDWDRAPLPLGCVGAPYEVWCSADGEAAPLHWLPPPLAWVSHNRLVALGGLELEQKQALFPAHAHGSPYPSNALVVASLRGGGNAESV